MVKGMNVAIRAVLCCIIL